MKNDSKPPSSSQGDTRIDLGDDLIEKTNLVSVPQANSREEWDASDQLQSAKILMSEGMWEDAKKILRKVLILDPKRVAARQFLDEIQEKELKQLFGNSSQRKFQAGSELKENEFSRISTEEVIRALDQDLRLGIDHPEFTEIEAKRLEVGLQDVGVRDRIDLGIAFTEMGLYEVANRQFKAALQQLVRESISKEESDSESPSQQIVMVTALLAHGLILSGKEYEAVQLIQELIQQNINKPDHQLEFFYLLGRAYEAMNQMKLAHHWYQQTARIHSHYRDVANRLERTSGSQARDTR